jgi:tetratricopeptide (TPR) repeat protein
VGRSLLNRLADGMSEMELDRLFYEGRCLAASGDFDRANAAFLECVIRDPGRGDIAGEFLANLKRRTGDEGRGALADGRAAEAVTRAAAEGNWAEVQRLGPKVLAGQPGSVPTLLALAQSCGAVGHAAAEICYWNAAVEAAGDDLNVLRRAGAALARLCEDDAALACWRKVEAAERDGEQASEAILAITVAKSRRRNGLAQSGEARGGEARVESWGKKRDVAIQRPIFAKREGQFGASTNAAGLALTEIQQLEAAIRERPSIAELYLQLAQLYLDKDRDYDAERLLTKGRETTDRDARIQDMLDEVTILRHAKRVKFAKQEVKAADNPQTRAAHAQAVKERDKAELELFRGRCQRKPEDAASQLQLGLRLRRAEKPHEACEHFEKAMQSAEQRGAAAVALGDCLAELGDLPKALAQYRVAAFSGSTEEQKEALYQAGKLAMKMKLARLARRYLGEVVAVDAGYLDAAVMVDKWERGRVGEGEHGTQD